MGEGSKLFAHSTTSAPRVCVLVHCVRGAGEGQEVGLGVGGWVWEATMLGQSDCKRNELHRGTKESKKEEFEKPRAYSRDLRANGNDM